MGARSIVRPLRRIALVLVLIAPFAHAPAGAQQAIDKAANEIFGSVMSPFCPGMTLATCPSSQAADLRTEIRSRLAAGATKDEVIDQLYAVWGEDVLGPVPTGRFGVLAWLVPGAAIVLGAIVLALWLRSSSRRYGAAATQPADLSPEAKERLERELSQL
jgi:cytochrome c-type biogenesis protein CcmH/NrfF